MAAAEQSPGDEPSRVATLEAELERKDREMERIIERYEQVIDTRARLRRETPDSERFVWSGTVEQPPEQQGALERLRTVLFE